MEASNAVPNVHEIQCKIPNCGKMLSSKYNLKRHIESCHNGIRPYECGICYKRFSSKQNKREHVRLEHSYSIAPSALSQQNGSHSINLIQIPTLSSMLRTSLDPDIRPLAKVERIFMYSHYGERVELPTISLERQNQYTLPLDLGHFNN